MTSFEDWQTRNAEYLAAVLHWLRLRLQLRAAELQPAAAPAEGSNPPAAPSKPRTLFGRSAPPPAGTPLLPPHTPERIDRASVDEAAARVEELGRSEPAPALVSLCHSLGLSAFEREVLSLCVGMELDTRVAELCARAQGDRTRPYPTFALSLSLSAVPAWEALSPQRPLRRFRLVELDQPAAVPLTAAALRVDERVLGFVKGLNQLDERIAAVVSVLGVTPVSALSEAQADLAQRLTDRVRSALEPLPLIRLAGSDLRARKQFASAVSGELGLSLLCVNADSLPAGFAEGDLPRLWQRESLLLPLALYVDASGAEKLPWLHRLRGGLVFFEGSDALAGAQDGVETFEIEKPPAREQAAVWRAELAEHGDLAPELASTLAAQFNLNLAEIREIASRASDSSDAVAPALWRACREKTRPALGALAQKLDPKASWDDIVLPKAELALLRQIANQVQGRARVYDEWGFRARMNRGLGISALFAGESGTGKTMAAEVLANALDLDLYRIDLSAVVSKYIGETEKNLRQLFDVAEQGGVILFFDEADALFGKRSEVKDSHDRYANIEINYLLQRMEAFSGLAILASNLKNALDPAFVRRLRFILNFTYPAATERQQIWERAFPPSVPRGELDFARLAKFNLTGGNIHSIALNAAFLAAERGREVSMPLILESVRLELRKLERPINEADLRWVEPSGAVA